MRLLIIALFSSFIFSASWLTDFEAAKQSAQQNHKFILLNFSGSDWCGPCIRMHTEIFDSEAFSSFANDQLVLVKADFPRLKKNQLSKEQQQLNDRLAEKYNNTGIFPLTVLLTADGKPIKTWEGLPKESAAAFTEEVNNAIHAGN